MIFYIINMNVIGLLALTYVACQCALVHPTLMLFYLMPDNLTCQGGSLAS